MANLVNTTANKRMAAACKTHPAHVTMYRAPATDTRHGGNGAEDADGAMRSGGLLGSGGKKFTPLSPWATWSPLSPTHAGMPWPNSVCDDMPNGTPCIRWHNIDGHGMRSVLVDEAGWEAAAEVANAYVIYILHPSQPRPRVALSDLDDIIKHNQLDRQHVHSIMDAGVAFGSDDGGEDSGDDEGEDGGDDEGDDGGGGGGASRDMSRRGRAAKSGGPRIDAAKRAFKNRTKKGKKRLRDTARARQHRQLDWMVHGELPTKDNWDDPNSGVYQYGVPVVRDGRETKIATAEFVHKHVGDNADTSGSPAPFFVYIMPYDATTFAKMYPLAAE